MGTTHKLIASYIVGGSGISTIDFTNIPDMYTDLLLKVTYRTTDSSNTGTLTCILNNDSSNSYINKFLTGNGSSGSSGTYNPNNSAYFGYGNIFSSTSNTYSNAEIYIPNYLSSTYKNLSSENVSENNASTAYQTTGANLWNNTAAINRITLGVYAQSFAPRSTAYLYGIKKN